MEIFDHDRALRAGRIKDAGRLLFVLGATSGDNLDREATAAALYGDPYAGLMRSAMATHMFHDPVKKSAVAVSDASSDGAYAGVASAIVEVITDEFIGAKIGARRVSFTDQQMVQAIAASASFVGNGRAKPITRTSFAGLTIPPSKVAATLVAPKEAFAVARPDLETALIGELTAAVARRLNAVFASAAAATTDAPAGLGYGAYPISSAGSTTANIVSDIALMIDAADSLDNSLSAAAFVASPKAYARLRLDRIASDDGSLAGLPLLSVKGATGLLLVDGSRVALAMDDTVAISRTEHANVELSDDPEADSGTVVSLFQKNLVGLRCELFVAWQSFGGGEGTSASPACVSLTSAAWA